MSTKDDQQKPKTKCLGRKNAIAQLNAIADLYQKRLNTPGTVKRPKLPDNKQNTTDNLQEIIDYLRVCVKYRELDVESLEREVKYLKNLHGDV